MIRWLEPGDAAAFRTIRLEGLELHPTAFGADYSDELALPLDYFERRLGESRVIGAFEDGELVGVIGIQTSLGRKLRHKGGIWGVYLRKSYRRKGLSQRLLDAAIAEARRLGLEWLELSVSIENHAARGLYKSRGFTIYGREPAGLRVDGADYDEDLMVLKL